MEQTTTLEEQKKNLAGSIPCFIPFFDSFYDSDLWSRFLSAFRFITYETTDASELLNQVK